MRLALASLVVVVAIGTARAEPVTLPRTNAVLDVPAGWTKLDTAGLVASYRSPSGLVLAVTRAQVANPDAWRAKAREAYVDQVERGALAAVPGQKRLARKLAEVNGVPALDLEIRRADGSALVMRILLYRTYALAVTIEVPKRRSLDEARAITTKVAPPKPAPKP